MEHYLLPLIYPPGLTPGTQWILGAGLLGLNLLLYGAWARGRLQARRRAQAAAGQGQGTAPAPRPEGRAHSKQGV